MAPLGLQELCEDGQRALMQMDYLAAEQTLAMAEQWAWKSRDFDSLSRLYMPLQEARRQRRQRCGEGPIWECFLPAKSYELTNVLGNLKQGHLIVARPGSLQRSIKARELIAKRRLYIDAFLAAAYEIGEQLFIAIAPL